MTAVNAFSLTSALPGKSLEKKVKRKPMTKSLKNRNTSHTFCRTFLVFLLITVLLPTTVGAEEKKDHMKAFMLSFLVPGLGQYYAGAGGYAKLFISAELALWGGYLYNNHIMDASRQDYYSQASLHAGINPEGKGTKYLNAIGTYNSSFDYNNRRLQSEFNPILYTDDMAWEWDSPESRRKFRDLREQELDYENNVKLFVAGIVLNHFLSGLNASRIVINENARSSSLTVTNFDGSLLALYRKAF